MVQDVSFYPERVTILSSLATGIESHHFYSDNYNNNYGSKDSL
jgi:hypothetical protein